MHDTEPSVSIFAPNKIIAHHSLTSDSGTVSWGAIRHYHKVVCGWLDIGYHAGVELVQSGDYEYYEVLFGRPWSRPGAHTQFHNSDSLGICFVGNYDTEEPPEAMLKAGAMIIAEWMKWFRIDAEQIKGHRDFTPFKTCPGTLFDIEKLKEQISQIKN